MKNKGIGGHQSAVMQTDEWLTPPSIIKCLGEFDLDPCSPIHRPWNTAKNHYTINDDGLLLPWYGRVWLNPPYGNQLSMWMEKMALHREGLALIFARTDTRTFHQYIFPVADSIFFIERRISFLTINGEAPKGGSGAPSVLIAYGEENVHAIEHSGLKGKHVLLNWVPVVVVGMNQSWKTIVSVAMVRLDGSASLEKIYNLVERIAPERVCKNQHYKAKVRQTLQMHFKRVKKGHYQTQTVEIEA